MENKTINNNPQRYTKTPTGWEVSSIGDSPNRNRKGEIKPIVITKGTTSFEMITVLGVDGIVVEIEGRYLVSPNTMNRITQTQNPHWDILANGSIPIKDKQAVIGRSIPIIKLDGEKWLEIGTRRDLVNKNAGVTEVDYVFEGNEVVSGITQGLINQINYTLGEFQRPGDSFSYYKYAEVNDPKYDIKALTIQATQSDGPIDQTKLNDFLLSIDDRLSQLSDDFNSIKRTFFYGELPATSGKALLRVDNKVASSDDESPIVEHQYIEKSSSTTNVQTSRVNAAIEATKIPTPLPDTPPRVPKTLQDFEREEKVKWDAFNASRSKLSKLFRKNPPPTYLKVAKARFDEAAKNGTL